MLKKLTTKEFIIRAKRVHGKMYDYSNAVYISGKSPISIICKEHGEFKQCAREHLRGRGCLICGYNKKRLSKREFVTRAKSVHGAVYDYKKTVYKGIRTKLTIVCRLHGKFIQDPNDHLHGAGCPKCSNNNVQLTTKEFVLKAKATHGNTYDYSQSIYSNAKTKIKIICKKHGVFTQKPHNHIGGQGCVNCSTSISKQEKEFLDMCGIPKNMRHVKIGKYFVDGYDKERNMVYEFLGDFWHGNPKKFNELDVNPRNKITYGSLFRDTFYRFRQLHNTGLKIKYVWELDWKQWKRGGDDTPPIIDYSPVNHFL